MALRHPLRAEPGDIFPKDDLVQPYVMRKPARVEFRSASDMSGVVDEVMMYPSVVLEAAVGSGKSTRFPAALARRTRQLVIHVLPSPLLAMDLATYVQRKQSEDAAGGVPVEYWFGGQQQVPRSGVLLISSAALVTLLCKDGPDLTRYGAVSVVLDEAHESDACTHLVRTMALTWKADRLVQMSATFGPEGTRMRETPGGVLLKTFPSDRGPDSWVVDEPGAPWNCTTLSNNLLIFIDSSIQAARLRIEYMTLGMKVHRLTSRMDPDDFSLAMRELRDKKGPLVVLLADYSFRSGFTFDVDRVVDTGVVTNYSHIPGEVRKVSRRMFEFESVQAAGRVGRIRPGTCEYYRPDATYEKMICDLEGVEREASAYLSRCLGYVPIGLLSNTHMSCEDLPANVAPIEALNSVFPLTYYLIKSDGSSRAASPVGERALRISDVPDLTSTRSPSVVSARSDDDRDGEVLVSPVSGPRVLSSPKFTETEAYNEFIRACDDGPRGSTSVEEGQYCTVMGMGKVPAVSMAFPEGLESVRRFLLGAGAAHRVAGLDKPDRDYALDKVVRQYLLACIEADAVNEIITGLTDYSAVSRGTGVRLFESLAQAQAERREMLYALRTLAGHSYPLKQVPPFSGIIKKRVEILEEEEGHGLSKSNVDHGRQFVDYEESLTAGGIMTDDQRYHAKALGYDGYGHGACGVSKECAGRECAHVRFVPGVGKVHRREKAVISVPSRFPLLPDKRVEVWRRRRSDGTPGRWHTTVQMRND